MTNALTTRCSITSLCKRLRKSLGALWPCGIFTETFQTQLGSRAELFVLFHDTRNIASYKHRENILSFTSEWTRGEDFLQHSFNLQNFTSAIWQPLRFSKRSSDWEPRSFLSGTWHNIHNKSSWVMEAFFPQGEGILVKDYYRSFSSS